MTSPDGAEDTKQQASASAENTQRQAVELEHRSQQLRQESAKLRARSAQLIARVTEIRQAVYRRGGHAHHPGDGRNR